MHAVRVDIDVSCNWNKYVCTEFKDICNYADYTWGMLNHGLESARKILPFLAKDSNLFILLVFAVHG